MYSKFIYEVKPYDIGKKFEKLIHRKYSDNIEAKLKILEFLEIANALGYRGQFEPLKVRGGWIIKG